MTDEKLAELHERINELTGMHHELHVQHTVLAGKVDGDRQMLTELRTMISENRVARDRQHAEQLAAAAALQKEVQSMRDEELRRAGELRQRETFAKIGKWIVATLIAGAALWYNIWGDK